MTQTPSPTAFNDAAFQGATIPLQIAAGQALPVSLTFLNTGNTDWNSGDGFALAVAADACGLVPGTRVALSNLSPVAPGGSGLFPVTLNPIALPAACTIQFQMIQDPGPGFGAVPEFSIQIVAAANNAQFLANTLPPSLAPDAGVHVGFTLRNLGTTAWFPGSNHALHVNSDPCSLFAQSDFLIPAGNMILTNQSYQFIIHMQSPGSPGACAFQLQMTEIGNGVFGSVFDGSLNIQVPANATRNWEIYE